MSGSQFGQLRSADGCYRCDGDVQESTADVHVNFAGVAPSFTLCHDCRAAFKSWVNEQGGSR